MAKGFIPLAKQMDFLWSELQGKEKAGFGKFLTAGANTPEDYATLWDKTYERSGGAGDAKARNYAGSVYAAMADGGSNPELISPNAKFTYGYLTNKGMTPQQAAGVTGRLMAESYEEMNPDARNTMAGGQGTYGVAQWRGSRMNDLANFAGVDVGGITSLPATAPGGGLLTSSGGANIMPMDPTKKPYMMGGDQTYSSDPKAAQQAQPKQGGLGGLLSSLKDKAAAVNPQTGMTGFQQFASALDPLIMKQFRGGEGIREAGAQRVASGNKNKTVEWLRKNGQNEIADAVMNGTIGVKEAFSAMQNEKSADTAFGRQKDLISFRAGLERQAASGNPNVQSSKMLPDDSGVVLTMKNGTVVVKTVGGETLSGQAALNFANTAHDNYASRQEGIYGARRTGTNVANIETGGEAASVVAEGTAAGKEIGRVKANLGEMQRNIPGLRLVVDQLSALSDEATYTALGQAANKVRKELGLETGAGAIARAEYIAVVDNQVLPLLRQTFGAQFTVAEGESLRATLGDPNKSPAEKKAVLDAFIAQKERDLFATAQSVSPQDAVQIAPNDDPLGLRN